MPFKGQASTGHFYTSVYNQLCKYLQKLWFLSLILYTTVLVQQYSMLRRLKDYTKSSDRSWLSLSC